MIDLKQDFYDEKFSLEPSYKFTFLNFSLRSII